MMLICYFQLAIVVGFSIHSNSIMCYGLFCISVIFACVMALMLCFYIQETGRSIIREYFMAIVIVYH